MKVIFLRVEVPDEWLNDAGGVDPCDWVSGVLFGDTTEIESIPPQRHPLTDEEKRNIATGWFDDEWVIKSVMRVIEDCEEAHGIGGKS